MVVAMGFSTSTWAPALRKARTISAWVMAGEQMLTRSTLPSNSRQSATASTPIGGGGAAHIGAGIGDREEFNIVPGFGQGAVFGGVMAAEGACPDDGGFQGTLFRHAAA